MLRSVHLFYTGQAVWRVPWFDTNSTALSATSDASADDVHAGAQAAAPHCKLSIHRATVPPMEGSVCLGSARAWMQEIFAKNFADAIGTA